jgi:hypothetical protein
MGTLQHFTVTHPQVTWKEVKPPGKKIKLNLGKNKIFE